MNPDLDAVLFDFSGVLTSSPTPMMLRRVEQLGITMEQFIPVALGPLDTDTDHPWHRAERGEIGLAEFAAAVAPVWEELGANTPPAPPSAADMAAEMSAIDEMVAVARDARAAGYRTAVVSNVIRDWLDAWRSIVDAAALVDVVIDSAVVGLRKPNPAIYELALEQVGVPADRAVFLDDFPWNVAGAEAVGIEAILVTDPVAAAAQLRMRLQLP